MSAAFEHTNINNSLSSQNVINPIWKQFSWLKKTLDELMSNLATEFWGVKLNAYNVAMTETPLFFWKENDYIVTQIPYAQVFNYQSRISNTICGIFLEESLGQRQDTEKYFKFKNITKLEAEIVTEFSKFIYKNLKQLFVEERKLQKFKEFSNNMLHLTFLFNTPDREAQDLPFGKIIISFPQIILKMTELEPSQDTIDLSEYYSSYSETNIFIGKAIITFEDLKKLTENDIIILDNSKLNRMTLFKDDNVVKFKVHPDPNIVLDVQSEDYDSMDKDLLSKNSPGEAIWDNLQVDVSAEFKKIKLPLGELRNMTEGLVVEVASMANNEVRLHIDGKDLAFGELVIVGDKYGVMVKKVAHKKGEANLANNENIEENNEYNNDENFDNFNLESDMDDDLGFDDDLGLEDEF